jgi:hypothetical protein
MHRPHTSARRKKQHRPCHQCSTISCRLHTNSNVQVCRAKSSMVASHRHTFFQRVEFGGDENDFSATYLAANITEPWIDVFWPFALYYYLMSEHNDNLAFYALYPVAASWQCVSHLRPWENAMWCDVVMEVDATGSSMHAPSMGAVKCCERLVVKVFSCVGARNGLSFLTN